MNMQHLIRIISRLAPLAFVLALSASTTGCNYRVHVGDHDAGIAGACSSDSDCEPGNHCACGRCESLDLRPAACNPSCDVAAEGDACMGAWSCAPSCSRAGFQCERGWARTVAAALCTDAGPWCECPAPPMGCRYDGEPCACSHMTCEDEPCGSTTCTGGMVCCNASCGICTPPGGACIDIECAGCDPMDARGEGLCPAFLGYVWDGMSCQGIGGCGCVGSDCASVYPTEGDCLSARSHCGGRPCGGFAGLTCTDSEFCDFDPSAICGAADGSGVCRPRPTALCEPPSPGSPPVCGCDGSVYSSECEARQAGTDAAPGDCGEMGCEPEDARGVGACDAIAGVVWDGNSCTSISGCSCAGADCAEAGSRLGSSDPMGECERAHAHCPRFFP